MCALVHARLLPWCDSELQGLLFWQREQELGNVRCLPKSMPNVCSWFSLRPNACTGKSINGTCRHVYDLPCGGFQGACLCTGGDWCEQIAAEFCSSFSEDLTELVLMREGAGGWVLRLYQWMNRWVEKQMTKCALRWMTAQWWMDSSVVLYLYSSCT